MIQFCVILPLVCFQTNVTVSLDVQTRSLIFQAWPRTDSSTKLNVCKSLSGDLYKLSIQTGSQTYALLQLQTYGVGAQIDITIPCGDLVNNCASAFKATSAIYVMEFQNAKVVVNEAAQNLRRVDFNRRDCVRDPKLLYGQNIQIAPGVLSNVFKFSGTPTQICKYPLDSMATLIANDPTQKKAVIKYSAYPNFNLESVQFSVSLSMLFQQGTYPCVMMPSPEKISWCNSMIQTFATESFGYNQVQYFVPGKVPNRDGTITRVANYSISYETNVVVNTLQATFDCQLEYITLRERPSSNQHDEPRYKLLQHDDEQLHWVFLRQDGNQSYIPGERRLQDREGVHPGFHHKVPGFELFIRVARLRPFRQRDLLQGGPSAAVYYFNFSAKRPATDLQKRCLAEDIPAVSNFVCQLPSRRDFSDFRFPSLREHNQHLLEFHVELAVRVLFQKRSRLHEHNNPSQVPEFRQQILREPRFQPRTSQRNNQRCGSDRLQLGSDQFYQRQNGDCGGEERSVAGSRGRGGYGTYRSGWYFQTAGVIDLLNCCNVLQFYIQFYKQINTKL
ncbi:Conserved_hypothetical protein [Hexamita inflata]|uniref:Uncharacterized protein n=1 Tax=Hexamita inflata TaxID=28002 RepID=A0AA86TVK9_9EUKA|nr:Conserved hypothetical protein [Hexamita inflata]